MNQIVNMIMRMVMRKLMNKGMHAGLKRMSGPASTDPADRAQAGAAKAQSKRARQAMRVARRIGRF